MIVLCLGGLASSAIGTVMGFGRLWRGARSAMRWAPRGTPAGRAVREAAPPITARAGVTSFLPGIAFTTMAETVEFRSNGNMASGYLATPASGKGPGVLVIQEWWGLDSGIKEMADRLAAAGLRGAGAGPVSRRAGRARRDGQGGAPDAEPARRSRRRDMSGAVDFLAGHPSVTSEGHRRRRASAWAACCRSSSPPTGRDKVKAVVPFYGFPQGATEPDWSKLSAKIRATWPSTTTTFRRPPRARSRPSCAGWART